MIWLFLACEPPVHYVGTPSSDSPIEAEVELEWTELDTPRLFRRMHLDLTGELPPAAVLDTLAQDPAALATYRAALWTDPRLEDRLVVLLGERWKTQIDEYLFEYKEYAEYYTGGIPEYRFERSVANEPLHLMARIVVEDRPWTEIVTADTTVANELIGGVWPLDYPAGEEGWLEVAYTDGRPGAGILSTNGLWWRYYTTVTNYNRGRVAMLADQLVCEDIIGRPVDLTEAPVLSEGDDISEAISTVPYCQGCHASLDPAAAALFGFWTNNEHSRSEFEVYHPEREAQGEDLLGVEMAWFGVPVDGLEGLGVAIANDPRFDRCAAQNFAEMFWRRDVGLRDRARVDDLRAAFIAGDRRAGALIEAVMDTPEYRADALPDGLVEGDEVIVRQMPPQMLASAVEGATGFRWMAEGFDQMDNSVLGYRTLGGGVDGEFVTSPQDVPSASHQLVVRRLAEGAAAHAIASGHIVGPEQDVDAWVAELYWALTARTLSESDQAGLVGVFAAVEASAGEDEAAAAVVAAVLQDPEFWTW